MQIYVLCIVIIPTRALHFDKITSWHKFALGELPDVAEVELERVGGSQNSCISLYVHMYAPLK